MRIGIIAQIDKKPIVNEIITGNQTFKKITIDTYLNDSEENLVPLILLENQQIRDYNIGNIVTISIVDGTINISSVSKYINNENFMQYVSLLMLLKKSEEAKQLEEIKALKMSVELNMVKCLCNSIMNRTQLIKTLDVFITNIETFYQVKQKVKKV